MADSIFDKSDSEALDDLPAELKGKTPAEVAAYYQRREQILLRTRQAAPAPKQEEPVDDHIDMFNDPKGSIDRIVTRKVAELGNRQAAVATPAIISSCRTALKEAHPNDYARFIPEIEKRMGAMNAESQMNPQYWEMTYTLVKGENADKLAEEARTAERNKRENPVETGNKPGEKPAKPRELSEEEKVVARKFGITNEEYRTAETRYDETEGKLPFTYDSKAPRQRRKAG